MPAYTIHDIRNIAFVGQSGAGKTTLIEALLHNTGMIKTIGEVNRGTTVCDFDPQEKQYQHSLNSALAYMEAEGKHINLLDTPGLGEFFGRTFGVLQAAETAAIVINAENGIEPATKTMMEHAKRDGLCRLIVINKIDADEIKLEALVEEIKQLYGSECLPLNLPAIAGDKVIDCFFNPEGEATLFSSVPEAHATIIDQVVEVDEALMEVYLEQGEELSPEQLHAPFEKALREGHLIPICFCSAETGTGIAELVDIMVRLMPDPTEGNPPHFLKGEGANAEPVTVTASASEHVIAHVFKISNDPFKGKLAFFRVYQGTITRNTQLFIGDARKPLKTTHLLRLQGENSSEVDSALPGDICAIARVDELFLDAVLHDSHDEDNFHLQPETFPMPLFGLALTPKKRGDEQKLSDALHKLQSEDYCLRIEHNAQANETVVRSLGELHLRIVLEQLEQKYKVTLETHPPSIPYRETICAQSKGHYRHKKQTGGAGQFGEVFLTVAPLERGGGFKFINEIKGGVIPGQFIPAVEKGIKHALEEGYCAGFPIQDVQVTLVDGKYHNVDSKEIAFVTAGKKAFQIAMDAAKPVVLEPIVTIQITAQDDTVGDITADLSTRRGRINNTEASVAGQMLVVGQVPLAEIESYSTRLKSMTGGKGSYEISFSHYDSVPANRQKELSANHQAEIHHED